MVTVGLYKHIVWTCIVIIFLGACTHKSEYSKVVERELAKGTRQDSLFLGLKFGMSQKEFFNHCWELNQQNILSQGTGLSVRYEVEELNQPAVMNFYPEFHEGKIYQLPISMSYVAWAPWNRNLYSDSLQVHVLKLLEEKHGKGFIKVEHPEKGIVYVKVDSNRRISIYRKNDSDIAIVYTDLLIGPPVNSHQL